MRNKPCTVFSKKHTPENLPVWVDFDLWGKEQRQHQVPWTQVECRCTQKKTALSECQLSRVWLGAGGRGGGAKTKNFSYGRVLEFRLFELHNSGPAATGHPLLSTLLATHASRSFPCLSRPSILLLSAFSLAPSRGHPITFSRVGLWQYCFLKVAL